VSGKIQKSKKFSGIIKILVILTGFLVTITAVFFYLNSPPPEAGSNTVFIVDPGATVLDISNQLKENNLIRSKMFFYLLVKLAGKERDMKAGEYSFERGIKNTDILRTIVEGRVVTVKFTIPEGYNCREIAEKLSALGIVDRERFIQACKDKEILDKYKIPFDSVEGFLFPDTYIVAKNLNEKKIVEVMVKNFFRNVKKIDLDMNDPERFKKVIIIASLVEKEAKLDEERALIAAVFYNRLEKGKRLESCATIQYILGKPKERLLISDLRVKSPYNTYLNNGLPPGPISNPGLKSLMAAANPANVDYLFFVSKRDGSHYFSRTYSEHLKAIKKYGSGKLTHHLS